MVFEQIVQLLILFFVIFDPPASLMVFITATKSMKARHRQKIAALAILVAASVSLLFLVFGEGMLGILNTTIESFRIAGGIMLGILGIKMARGKPLSHIEEFKDNSGRAIASIIGTPLLTGPAAISAIILSTSDYGILQTGTAIAIVLAATFAMFMNSERIGRIMGVTASQVLSTILGLITLAWGVDFVLSGLGI